MLETAAEFVKKRLGNEGSGHDWLHIDRVRRTARMLSVRTDANLFVVEMAALLHDLPDRKLRTDIKMTKTEIEDFLSGLSIKKEACSSIMHIIDTISFNGSGASRPDSLEGQIVQDADRLDAIGAVGIARAFIYSGSIGQPMYSIKEEEGSAIRHFHEKLLKLKDLMNTEAGKAEAAKRHLLLESYLKAFYSEIEGEGLQND